MVKKLSQQAANSRAEVTAEQAELLAKRLADKPYGSTENTLQEPEKQSRTTISLNESMLVTLEDMALKISGKVENLKVSVQLSERRWKIIYLNNIQLY